MIYRHVSAAAIGALLALTIQGEASAKCQLAIQPLDCQRFKLDCEDDFTAKHVSQIGDIEIKQSIVRSPTNGSDDAVKGTFFLRSSDGSVNMQLQATMTCVQD